MSSISSASPPIVDFKPTVLIVDDTAANIEMLGAMLRVKDIQVVAAINGPQALTIAEAKMPDVILLDIQMPDMDGYAVCQKMKSNPVTQDIPIIFLTAKNETADIVKGFELGAVDYITKPFRPQELFARLRTHLQLTALQKQTLAQNQELVTLNKLKDEFLGVAVHDLKNPLSGITGLAEYLRDNEEIDREMAKHCLDTIITQSTKMFAIIKNLLNVNAIERGALSLHITRQNLPALAQSTTESYGIKAEGKNLTLHTVLEENCDVLADEISTIQILDNLISNAIKFSPEGKTITVAVRKTPHGVVALNVQDEGPGLTDEDKTKLFTTFAKLSAQPTAGEHSTGLGLSIVKRLAEVMNATVRVESTYSKGATFIVEFPAAPLSIEG
jgi:signal transduction histidine kinase